MPLPSVLLHDHLDGGPRSGTVLELAEQSGYGHRLMSGTTMSREMEILEDYHGFDGDDLALTAKRSLAAAFCDYETKVEIWEDVPAPAYAAGGARVDEKWR